MHSENEELPTTFHRENVPDKWLLLYNTQSQHIMGPVTSGSEKMPMITPENPFSVLRHFANSEIFK